MSKCPQCGNGDRTHIKLVRELATVNEEGPHKICYVCLDKLDKDQFTK